jgi:3'-phosphoadenosine 5'-phosphosulfate sulfotransferase (PAPS reductase)/FAD synthetase
MILEREKIVEMAQRGAIFYVSHSGGKDSQAMYIALLRVVPHDQIVVVHADLGKVEWEGVQDHISNTIRHPLNVVRANKTFFEMVKHRARTRPDVPPWPSSATRQCTSDLKRGPIHKFIRNDMKARGATLAVNCTGIRAEESAARKKKVPFKLLHALCLKERTLKSGRVIPSREIYEYMPIHHLTTRHVFWIIEQAGQRPHSAYSRNKRLSCVICIMGCEGDILHGAEQRPDLVQEITAIEELTGYTMFNGQSLGDRIEKAKRADAA